MIEGIRYDEIKIITIFSFILDYKITNYKLHEGRGGMLGKGRRE